MEHFNADLELALLHIKQVEQRVADQYVRVERLKRIGASSEVAKDFLRTLQDSLRLLKRHLAYITGPVNPDKTSTDCVAENLPVE